MILRLLTECFILFGPAMFGATFNLVSRVGLPYFSEHWKIVVWKLLLYQLTTVLATGMSWKMVLILCQKKNLVFLFQKAQNFVYISDHMICLKFWKQMVQVRIKYFMERLYRHSVSALIMVAQKSLNVKITAKNIFSDRRFYVTITDAVIGSLKSLNIIW